MPTSSSAIQLYTVAQIRAMEHRLVERDGGIEVMRRAAEAALQVLRQHWPQARRVAVWCGPGNNGGDGFLLAALARAAGLQVEVRALSSDAKGDAARARQVCIEAGAAIHDGNAFDAWPEVDLHVDALYGIGLNRAPSDAVAALIERINADGKPVLALDTPSGLNADTGQVPGVAIRAAVTVTFLADKRGLHTGAAADHVGEVIVASLGLTDPVVPDAVILEPSALPRRSRVAHKGGSGHVLAIGGDHGTAGAIRLCGESALRCGAGLVSVATRAEHLSALNAARPELMAHAVQGPQELESLIQRADVLAVGPGLGQGAWGHALWLAALAAGKPMVLDADGLNLLARAPREFDRLVVLTPHPGEAARLLDTDVPSVEHDRFAAVRELARRYRAVAVLKGAGSLIADPAGRVAVCPWGNPGMASGGMGDLLTGIIAGLLAQHCEAWEAACLGVSLHARAGDRAARAGERGLLATDLLQPLHALVNGHND